MKDTLITPNSLLRWTRPVANLIKHITIVNYDARVVLTTNLPILRP